MAARQSLQSLSNPLASVEQLAVSASSLDGLPDDLVDSVRYQGCVLTQSAGILLRLQQDIIARAIITFTRFYTGPEGGSFLVHAAKDISAACLYLTAKSSATPVTTRSLLNVYAYLTSPASLLHQASSPSASAAPSDPTSCTLTVGAYQSALLALQRNETLVLRLLSFTTRSVLPHSLALTYLQTLGATGGPVGPRSLEDEERRRRLPARTLALLNTALLSPQRLYLTHQPHELAVAAVYLAARQVGVKLVGDEEAAESWWEVFDVDREALGFLAVGMLSTQGWVEQEKEKGRAVGNGGGGRLLLGLGEVEAELKKAVGQDV